MPAIVREPVEQQPFERSMVSPELEGLFRYVLGLREYDPPHVDDAADVLDELNDDELSQICQSPVGDPVDSIAPSLRYSSQLRQKLSDELVEIDICLDNSSCGWLIELLEEGRV